MKQLENKKILNFLGQVAWCLGVCISMSCLIFYLAGVWQIQIGELVLNFSNMGYAGFFSFWLCYWKRDKVGARLSAQEKGQAYALCRERRLLLQLKFCLIWCIGFAIVYAIGQVGHLHEPYQQKGSLTLFSLVVVCLHGLVFGLTLIPMPDHSDAVASETTEV